MNITISFGLSNSLSKEVPSGTTLAQVLADRNIRGALGFGENVNALVDGATVSNPNSYVLEDGDEIQVEARAGSKAA